MKKIVTIIVCLIFASSLYSQNWIQMASVPGLGRQGAFSFVINGKVYVGGGEDSLGSLMNDFYEYNPDSNTWTSKANLLDYYGGSGCFALNGKGYTVCGQNNSQNISQVYQYDPVLDQWNTMSAFPGPAMQHPVSFTIGDSGYVFGGFIGGSEVNTLWAYYPDSDSWTEKASMPSVGRGSATGFVLNNIGYVGLGEYNSGANLASDFGAYNPATNTWSAVAQFPGHLRSGPLSFALGSFAYVGLGNYDSAGLNISCTDIFQYNPVNNSWSPGGNFPGASRSNSLGVSLGDTIYIGTGCTTLTQNYFTDWWRYIYQINVNLGTAKTVCSGSSVILNPIVTGAIAPVTYAWSSTGDSLSCYTCQNPTVTITDSSTYTLTVTDANNTVIIDTISYVASATTSTLQATLSNTGIKCFGPVDTTTAVIANGTTPVLYQWGDGSSITELNTATHYYNQSGVFIFSATDSLGCIISLFDTVPDSTVTATLGLAVPPHCLNDSSGKIIVNVAGGTPPYSYTWNTGGSTTDSLTGLPAGDYQVTVVDASSCSSQLFEELNPANDVWDYYIYLNGVDPNCSNNGSLTTSVYGGTTPYTYIWSNGDTTPIAANLGAGTYYVTVTDSTGCPRTAGALLNLYCASVISGYIFIDSNQNCVFDSNELVLVNALVSATGSDGNIYFGCTDWTGYYSIPVYDTGTYNIQIPGLNTGYCETFTFCGNANQNVTVDTPGNTYSNNNFTANGASGFDLTIHPGWTSADPGFQKEYWVMPYNQSLSPFVGTAKVVFSYDSNLIYQYSLPPLPAVDTIAHTLTWLVADTSIPFPSWDWYNERFENFFMVPATLSLGYLLQSSFVIYPYAGDCDTANNLLQFSESVIGSHDPNEKTVSPDGNILSSDSVLTYTIHFQNTGTDSTWFIVLADTLSPYLNPATVKTIASSAPYSNFSITGKGNLSWTFNPLRLVDSVTNAQGSKGFVTFTVKKYPSAPVGAVISNTATVYFDYNSGVVTNTVTDTVSVAMGAAIGKVAAPISGVSVTAYPNPFSDLTHMVVNGINDKYDFELYDVTGRLKRKIQSLQTNQFELMRSDLADGIYFYHITVNNNQVASGKVVVQ